jgi:hypothetical protein
LFNYEAVAKRLILELSFAERRRLQVQIADFGNIVEELSSIVKGLLVLFPLLEVSVPTLSGISPRAGWTPLL